MSHAQTQPVDPGYHIQGAETTPVPGAAEKGEPGDDGVSVTVM